jgi:hypothetical protein
VLQREDVWRLIGAFKIVELLYASSELRKLERAAWLGVRYSTELSGRGWTPVASTLERLRHNSVHPFVRCWNSALDDQGDDKFDA